MKFKFVQHCKPSSLDVSLEVVWEHQSEINSNGHHDTEQQTNLIPSKIPHFIM